MCAERGDNAPLIEGLSDPQRKPATQSRPMEKAAAGGMSARQVGSPAGGRRTAAVLASLGAAATKSACHRFPTPMLPAPLCRAGGKIDGRPITDPGASGCERAAWKIIIDTQKLGISRDRKPGQKRVEALPGSCASLCDGTAIQSRAGVMTGHARNSLAPPSRRLGAGSVRQTRTGPAPLPRGNGEAICMEAVGDETFGISMRTSTKVMEENIPTGPVIYFIGAGTYVKIGYTADLTRRLAEIKGSVPHPATLLCYLPVEADRGRLTEATIHRALNDHRANGEWFLDCDEVRAALRLVRSGIIDWVKSGSINRSRVVDSDVAWASAALKKLAAPMHYNDGVAARIRRAAKLVGISNTRAFDVWYCKARRLNINERQAIVDAGGGP